MRTEATKNSMKLALLYLIGLVGAEWVTNFACLRWGVAFHGVLLAALIVHSSLAEKPIRKLLLSLALVPLIRILSLCMPLTQVPFICWYPIIYTPLAAACVVVMRNLNFSARDVGLSLRRLPLQIGVGLSGVGLGIGEYYILAPEPLVSALAWKEIWLPAIILLVFTGFVEELVFRGVILRAAGEALGHWDILYVSLLFATVHMIHHSALDIAFVFVIAFAFAFVVKRTGSLLGVILAHGLCNIFLYLIIPFLA